MDGAEAIDRYSTAHSGRKIFQGIECVSRGCVPMATKGSASAILEPSGECRSWW